MTSRHRTPTPRGRLLLGATSATVALSLLGACSSTPDTSADATSGSGFFDTSTVHDVSVEYDDADYQAMLDTFAETGDKDWIHATVTIDGTTYQDVGLRLKGNSSLRGLSTTSDDDAPARDEGDGTASAEDPEGLPWLVRLDKYVDGQQHEGRADLVVRGNNSESSLNEAVALHVLDLADVAAEQATYVRFSVNGGEEQLRLVLDLPDDDLWNEAEYGDSAGITYKADSEGDWSYRGDEASAYVDVFEAKSDSTGSTDEEAYAPLASFLQVVNESSDEEFADALADVMDVEELARYLAAQELVANQDDIDGPGNNAYLRYDESTGLMSVVAWDQNLSYGGMGGMGGGPGGQGGQGGPPDGADLPEGFEPPDGAELPDGADFPDDFPDDFQPPDGAAGGSGGQWAGGPGGRENTLVTRFLADDELAALYDDALAELTASVYDSGAAQEYLDGLASMLTEQASDLVDPDTVQDEADVISAYLDPTEEEATTSS